MAVSANRIGIIGEKTVHATLKSFLEPDVSYHEVKVGTYVVDIWHENEIIEIQTRQFGVLRKKLTDLLLQNYRVKVVYPVARLKWLIWIDEETGVATPKRKSPRTGTIYDILPELYGLKTLLTHPNLSFAVARLDIEEYRLLNGWSRDRKKGSKRCDQTPVQIVDITYIEAGPAAGPKADAWTGSYERLVPPGLPCLFTSKDFQRASKLSLRATYKALAVLTHIQVLQKAGKRGRMNLYEQILRD